MRVKFTDGWVKGVPLPGPPVKDVAGKVTFDGRQEYLDTVEPGLGMRVSWKGTKTWILYYRVKGDRRRRRLVLGTYNAVSLAKARLDAKAATLQAAQGIDPADKGREVRLSPTVAELAQQYLDLHAKLHKKSWDQDALLIRAHLVPAFGSRKAADVTRADLIAWLDRIVKRTPTQANNLLSLLKTMFGWAVDRGTLQVDPTYKIRRPAPKVERDRWLSDDELRRLWFYFTRGSSLKEAIFRVLLLTGQRSGEVMTMRWSDVDLAAGWWTVPSESAKNKRAHRVPLTDPVVAILKEREAAQVSELVFPSPYRRGQFAYDQLGDLARQIEKQSGIEWQPHDLRRTVATHLARMRVPRLVIGKLLNHASVDKGPTSIYDQWEYDPEKREALEAWSVKLMGIVGATGPSG